MGDPEHLIAGLGRKEIVVVSFFVDVSQRRRTPEVMDDPGLDAVLHASALKGLARINFWSGTVGALWSSIKTMGLASRGQRLRILDVASGGGDVPIGLWHRAKRAGIDAEVVGCDVSPVALEFARTRAASEGAGVEFRVVDALAGELPAGFDVVTNSLFLHHLDEGEVVSFLAKAAAAARRAVIVDDLVRSRAGHFFARVGTHLISRCDVVHVDGPRSVEGAVTIDEARALASRAGLSSANIVRRFPCRWHLVWTRP